MGISQRNNSEILDKMTRMQRAHEDHADALAVIQHFNARLSAKGRIWAWPTIACPFRISHPGRDWRVEIESSHHSERCFQFFGLSLT